jgi:hypothetical protein
MVEALIETATCMFLTPLRRRGAAFRSRSARGGGILALKPHPPLLRELLGEPDEHVGIAPFPGHDLVLPRFYVDLVPPRTGGGTSTHAVALRTTWAAEALKGRGTAHARWAAADATKLEGRKRLTQDMAEPFLAHRSTTRPSSLTVGMVRAEIAGGLVRRPGVLTHRTRPRQ